MSAICTRDAAVSQGATVRLNCNNKEPLNSCEIEVLATPAASKPAPKGSTASSLLPTLPHLTFSPHFFTSRCPHTSLFRLRSPATSLSHLRSPHTSLSPPPSLPSLFCLVRVFFLPHFVSSRSLLFCSFSFNPASIIYPLIIVE